MPTLAKDLWSLVNCRSEVDPDDLMQAIEKQIESGDLDYRTRLLIRDSVVALRGLAATWIVDDWLGACPVREAVQSICQEEFERPGFPSLPRRLRYKTKPEKVKKYLLELGELLSEPIHVVLGDAVALILTERLERHIEEVDFVDEIPQAIRRLDQRLGELESCSYLWLASRPSSLLPVGWRERLSSYGEFGQLRVFLADVIDVYLGKFFSRLTSDFLDLQMLKPQLCKDTVVSRLRTATAAVPPEPYLLYRAQRNWYILYGEPLPT